MRVACRRSTRRAAPARPRRCVGGPTGAASLHSSRCRPRSEATICSGPSIVRAGLLRVATAALSVRARRRSRSDCRSHRRRGGSASTIGTGFRFMTVPTARAAPRLPVCSASDPYVVVVPYSTRASCSSTRWLNTGSTRMSGSTSKWCRLPAKYSSSSMRTRSTGADERSTREPCRRASVSSSRSGSGS